MFFIVVLCVFHLVRNFNSKSRAREMCLDRICRISIANVVICSRLNGREQKPGEVWRAFAVMALPKLLIIPFEQMQLNKDELKKKQTFTERAVIAIATWCAAPRRAAPLSDAVDLAIASTDTIIIAFAPTSTDRSFVIIDDIFNCCARSASVTSQTNNKQTTKKKKKKPDESNKRYTF